MSGSLAAFALAFVGLVAVPVAPASAVEVANLTAGLDAPSPLLAGESGTLTVSADNDGPARFNLGVSILVPVGLVPGAATSERGDALGTPRVILPGALGAGQPPAGFQLWVFEDVADLPSGAAFRITVPYTPDPDVFPVGSHVDVEVVAHTSSDPTYRPVFPGSTGVGGAPAVAATASSAPVDDVVDITALRLEKTQVTYPENELLRGAHEQGAVYELVVTNTNQGTTGVGGAVSGIEVVDWIPAGLEFLGCADADHSSHDWSGTGDGEYTGAGVLGAGVSVPSSTCRTPATVETVVASASDASTYDVTAGRVYTRVTWRIASLAEGATTTISYGVVVPLHENTVDWGNAPDGAAPSASSREQGANLDNNTGPSTRHGDPASHEDGDAWTNAARASGHFDGPVVPGTDREVWDADTETITAMDLAIVKSVDRSDFAHGGYATYTLTVSTSEYASSADITVTDVIPDGMCLVASTASTSCVTAATGGTFGPWTVEDVTLGADGSRTVTFRYTPGTLAANAEVVLTYPVLMGVTYAQAGWGPTTAGDSFSNEVEIEGTTTLEPGVTDRFPGEGPWDVWDDSRAGLSAPVATISKEVLGRSDLPGAGCTAADPSLGAWHDGDASDPATGFRLGDTVCYLLTVNFPAAVDTRNAVVTDVLPAGIELQGWQARPGSPTVTQSGTSLEWQIGSTAAGTSDRIVVPGSTLRLYVWGKVTHAAVNPVVDKPENLMKYRQENVHGEVFFLRDQAAIEVVPPPLSLLKGVQDVDGDSTRDAASGGADGDDFNSNRDGIHVVQGETITYRIDLSSDYPVSGAHVIDLLPEALNGLTAGQMAGVIVGSPGATLAKGTDLGLTGANANRWVLSWVGVVVDTAVAGEYRASLSYDLTVPVAMSEIDSSHTNTATLVSYAASTNTGGTAIYHPEDAPDYTGRPPAEERLPAPEGRTTTDPSHVLVDGVEVVKSVASVVGTNNPGPALPSTGANTSVAIGEWATYRYAVTIPAHTSVVSAILSDALPTPANWEVDASKTRVTYPGGTWTAGGANTFTLAGATFTVTPATGALTFPTGAYTVGASDETFTVEITARVRPGATWTHSTTTNRTNTASFTSSGSSKGTATAATRVIEPDPRVSKVASDDSIVAEQEVDFTLQAWNASGRPTSFDTVVVDCVPAGLAVTLPVTAPSGTSVVVDASPAPAACAGTLITWTIGDLAAEGSTPGTGEIASRQSLTYSVVIDPAAGGGVSYENTARVTGYSVPDDRTVPTDPDPRRAYTRSVTETITAEDPTIVKTVDGSASTDAVVGEIVDYEVVVTVPAQINLYDTSIVDVVPAGIAISDVEVSYGPTWATAPSATPTVSGQTITLALGDVASATTPRTVTLRYHGTVRDTGAVSDGVELDNTATLTWNGVDNTPTTSSSVDDEATVTVLEPEVTISKKVDHPGTTPAAHDAIDVDAGGSFHYRIVVTNTGTSPAYDVEVKDAVPAGVVVDPGSLSPAGTLGVVNGSGGRTITWTIPSIAVGAQQVITYSATLASSSILDSSALTNVADVTELFSHPGDEDGEDYDDDERRTYPGPQDEADVTPLFPEPTVTKSVDPGVTALGEPVSFEIVVRNDGDSPLATYTVTDTLPVGWTASDVDPVATLITPGTSTSGPVLMWQGTDLDVDDSVTITYEATPDPDHDWTVADLGLAAAKVHTNTVRVTGTDGSAASGHIGTGGTTVSYEDEDEADVNIPLADLELTKSVVTDPADVVAGEPLTWALDVRNLGPDAESGPVTITDEIPAGVVADSIADLAVTGTGWTVESYDPVTRLLTLEHAGGVAAPSVGGPGSIPRVTVTADVDPGFVPLGSTTRNLVNAATVSGTTDEVVTDNNDDDATIAVRASADLELVKSAVTGSYIPGTAITWEIDVTNHGPSVSRTPFTVTDTLPAEVDPTTFELVSGADWSVVGSGPVAGVVTLRYNGDDLGAGDATSTVRVRATVRSSLLTTDPIVNEAEVHPTTPDEDPSNNEDEAPVDHDTALADLSLVKSLASDEIVAGESGRYRIAVTNLGPSYAVDVVVTDVLPAGLTYAGDLVSRTGDTWLLDDELDNGDGTTTLTFTLDSGSGMLPDGNASWFEFDVDVASWVTADVTNVAEASATTPDPEPINDEDSVTTTPLVETNLSITKVHDDAVRRVGDTVVFTVEVTNHGPADAEDVEIVDALPAGLTFEGLTDVLAATDGRAWSHAVVDDELTATLDDPLPAGETAVVEITATLTAASFPSVTNTVTVSTTTDETDPDDNEATDPVPVDSPDLRVVKTAGSESVEGGDELVYTIVVTNHGGAHADVVTVTDTIPAELSYLSSAWDTTDPAHAVGDPCVLTGADADGLGGTLECVLATGLAAGQSATLVVTTLVPDDVAVDEVTNTVTVASDDEDPTLRGDDDDAETTPVRWMSATVAPVCVLEAPWLDYDVELHNVAVGSALVAEWFADADGDGVGDGSPIHTETVAVSAGDHVSGRVLWPGAEVDEDGIATVLPGFRPAVRGETATWQNLVEDESLREHALRGDVVVRFSINPVQDVATSYPDVTPDCLVDRDTQLEISKSVDAERVDAGDRLSYEIEVRSTGNGAARDVVVTDEVPAQLKVERVTTAKPSTAEHMPWRECTVTDRDDRGYGGVVTCELDGVLARGQVAPAITIVATVDPDAESGDVVNVAEVEWTSADGDEETGVADDAAEVEVVGDEDLATTGADLVRAAGVALVLVLLGTALVLVVRVRRA